MFDLPTETPKQRKIYAQFRKQLLSNGFKMFQFSIYIRHCPSRETAQVYKRMLKNMVPEEGAIGVLEITDKQFEKIEIYIGKIHLDPPPAPRQLTLF